MDGWVSNFQEKSLMQHVKGPIVCVLVAAVNCNCIELACSVLQVCEYILLQLFCLDISIPFHVPVSKSVSTSHASSKSVENDVNVGANDESAQSIVLRERWIHHSRRHRSIVQSILLVTNTYTIKMLNRNIDWKWSLVRRLEPGVEIWDILWPG